MRPVEMKNLRWRDITPAKDREGREIVVLFVQGKDKTRRLVVPESVGDYLDRIRNISKATSPNDKVFTTITGRPETTLYSSLIADLLTKANLREGTQGVPRSTYFVFGIPMPRCGSRKAWTYISLPSKWEHLFR
jgi:hypothetical protein